MHVFKKNCFLIEFAFVVLNFIPLYAIDVFMPDEKGLTLIDRALLQKNNELVQQLFDSSIVAEKEKNLFNAELSLGIVDLKFDGEKIKICELGEGTLSTFKGFDCLYGKGEIWRRFWHYLSFIGMPCWVVALHDRSVSTNVKNAYEYFVKIDGRFAESLSALIEHRFFKGLQNEPYCYERHSLTDYKALIIRKSTNLQNKIFCDFKKKYSNVLFLNEATGRFMGNKFYTNQLFQDEQLRDYRPGCKVCSKKYYLGLADEIIQSLNTHLFVIKPIHAARGFGVIMVDKEHLDATLKLILTERGTLEKLKNDIAYSYWLNDKSPLFLVEEYVPSKFLTVNGVTYDPTMRVVFVLSCDNGIIRLNTLGSYWKLPLKGINEQGTLTELHKSNINPNRECSASVSQADYEKVKIYLQDVLPKIYIKMLQYRETGKILPLKVKKAQI